MPAENLLGAEGQGFVNFMRTLDSGRIGIAALSLGIAEGAFEEALRVRDACASSSARPIAELPGRRSSSSPTWRRRSRPAST